MDLKDAFLTIPIHTQISQIQLSGGNLPVQLPTIWSVLGVHKSFEAPSCSTLRKGNQSDSLYRQHTGSGRVEGNDTRSTDRYALPTRVPGVHHQQRQVNPYPKSEQNFWV